ncbi:hypothetical protein RhiXN_05718 [Rhizoctonia solani]|uniref:Uncharacterized protein n=1 Tax=Rhizoctonia solani TaxID=456999 RepID=A0A8H8SWU6_9AGAM|nr:uncharacterized protein RhiXN_05718 [Rhizoctonia solani]QRW20729.1 hypothetical protein RhiXN_05718 [Rhizoctonia solani]
MSEPTVTSTSSTHTAPVSTHNQTQTQTQTQTYNQNQNENQDQTKPHPHSVAHEEIPPESRPVGSEEHGTTGPNDPPPGAAEGEMYPPQKHAGKVGYGPHYAEVHGKETGLGAKLTGMKEQLKGRRKEPIPAPRRSRSRRKTKEPVNPSTAGAGDADLARGAELKPGANKTDTQGGPVEEKIPSSAVTPSAEVENDSTFPRTHDTTKAASHDPAANKSHDATGRTGAGLTTGQDETIHH